MWCYVRRSVVRSVACLFALSVCRCKDLFSIIFLVVFVTPFVLLLFSWEDLPRNSLFCICLLLLLFSLVLHSFIWQAFVNASLKVFANVLQFFLLSRFRCFCSSLALFFLYFFFVCFHNQLSSGPKLAKGRRNECREGGMFFCCSLLFLLLLACKLLILFLYAFWRKYAKRKNFKHFYNKYFFLKNLYYFF